MNKKIISTLLSALLLGETSTFISPKAADQKNTNKTTTAQKNDDQNKNEVTAKKVILGTLYAGALTGYGIGLYCLLTKDSKSAQGKNSDIDRETLGQIIKMILDSTPEFKTLADKFPIEYAESNIAESIFDRNMKLRFKEFLKLLKFVRENNPDKQLVATNEFIQIIKNDSKNKQMLTYYDAAKISIANMLKDIPKINSNLLGKETNPLCKTIISKFENRKSKSESKNDAQEAPAANEEISEEDEEESPVFYEAVPLDESVSENEKNGNQDDEDTSKHKDKVVEQSDSNSSSDSESEENNGEVIVEDDSDDEDGSEHEDKEKNN